MTTDLIMRVNVRTTTNVFFPGVFLSSRVTGACPVTTDLIMRVNVRTTTTVYRIESSLLALLFGVIAYYCELYVVIYVWVFKQD